MHKGKGKWLSIALCTVMTLTTSLLVTKSVADDNKEAFAPTISAVPAKGNEVNLLQGDFLEYASNYKKYKSAEFLPDDYPIGYSTTGKKRPDDYAPKALTLSWESEEGVEYYTVKLSANQDLSDAASYVTLDPSLVLPDLYAGTSYYYQIIAKFADKTVKSQIFHFNTAQLIRTIELEGVSNTRDIGGYSTEDGKRIRQGMVYRGGKLEDMTPAAKEKALKVYGFKTDLDLRAEATASPLGSGVNFVNVSGPYYAGDKTGIISTNDSSKGPWKGTYRDALITEIKTFANPENYPIYVHCSLGRDRTGTIVFLINALCGVGETDLYMDYEASFFSTVGCLDGQTPATMVGESFTDMFRYIKNYGGGSLADKTEAFMMDQLGITQAEIDSIRSIMIEEVK